MASQVPTAVTGMGGVVEEAEPDGLPAGGEATKSGGLARQYLRVFVENKLAVIGAAVIVLMVLFCFIGPIIYPTNQTSTQDALLYSTQNAPPSAQYPLGTDQSGFDMLGRIMYGGQVSLEVGFAAAAIATVVGVLFGAISGFFGGWLDGLMMRIVDVVLSVPLLFLVIVLAVIFQPSLSILIYVIGFTAWLVPARLIRGETLTLRTREYVMAVRVMGGSGRTDRHPPHHPEHDRDDHGQRDLPGRRRDPAPRRARVPRTRRAGTPDRLGLDARRRRQLRLRRVLVADHPAGVAIVLVVVAFNFVGDALRDSFEVRLQRR